MTSMTPWARTTRLPVKAKMMKVTIVLIMTTTTTIMMMMKQTQNITETRRVHVHITRPVKSEPRCDPADRLRDVTS